MRGCDGFGGPCLAGSVRLALDEHLVHRVGQQRQREREDRENRDDGGLAAVHANREGGGQAGTSRMLQGVAPLRVIQRSGLGPPLPGG